jgi:hypothetical protein
MGKIHAIPVKLNEKIKLHIRREVVVDSALENDYEKWPHCEKPTVEDIRILFCLKISFRNGRYISVHYVSSRIFLRKDRAIILITRNTQRVVNKQKRRLKRLFTDTFLKRKSYGDVIIYEIFPYLGMTRYDLK